MCWALPGEFGQWVAQDEGLLLAAPRTALTWSTWQPEEHGGYHKVEFEVGPHESEWGYGTLQLWDTHKGSTNMGTAFLMVHGMSP